MIDFIEDLKGEHEEIERELIELESIMDSGDINYSNLAHTFRKLCDIWDKHERKEEKIFPVMEKERIIVPVEKMLSDHIEFRPHKNELNYAIESGSQEKMKKALLDHGKFIIDKLRTHMDNEENILFAITIEIFTPEEIKEIENNINPEKSDW